MSHYGYCPYCGHEGVLNEGTNICSECGAEFDLHTLNPPG